MPREKGVNVKLLDKVIEHMEAEPKRANMDTWLDENEQAYHHPCHTVGCIAGWTVALKKGRKKAVAGSRYWENIQSDAKKLLRITHDQAQELFLPGNWPSKFQERMDKSKGPGTKSYVKVIKARIKAFQKEYGPK